MADLSSEGSPSVPQQPVERWTIYVCECGGWGTSGGEVFPCPFCNSVEQKPVEVVPALVAERLAEALREIKAMADTEGPWTKETIWFETSDIARAALSVYESGGATKPGEET